MPRRFNGKRKYKRKRKWKPRRKKTSSPTKGGAPVSSPGYPLPFPKTKKCTLKYTEYDNESTTLGNVATKLYALNSLYDPTKSGTGHQPLYFDQLCNGTLYNKYQVDSISYKVTFINKDSKDCQVGIGFTNSTTAPTTAIDLYAHREHSRHQVRFLLPHGDTSCRTTFTGTRQVWPLLARSKQEFLTNTDEFSGFYTGDPPKLAYLQIYSSDNPQDTGGSSVDYYLEISYHCTLFSRNDETAQS